jgi:arylsulfate sulfotransferase
VHLVGQDLSAVRTVSYVVEPKPGSVSKPVRVTYTLEALERKGRLETDHLELPVFGLYAGYANEVSIELTFDDDSTQIIADTLTTAAYTDPNGVYDQPVFVRRRAPDSELDFDFFAMKSGLGTPVIVDTDGAIRWVGVSDRSSISSVFTDNGFVVGSQGTTRVWRFELDGTETEWPAAPPVYRRFHHNTEVGRTGLLGELDTFTDRQSTIAEFTRSGGFYKVWDFATIVTEHLRSAGDDPSLLVRPPNDWFHTNSAVYDARDDSLIVSAREHFVMNVDYDTGAIRWVLGDPTKYWWQFPSLRAKALTLESPGLYPIGQHALSITHDGLLLLFNAGTPSEHQPTGAPRGESRPYSAVSAYRIDAATMTATEVWRFDYDQSLYSDHCSSAYEAGQSILVTYARANARLHARLVGLNSQHEVVFDFQYDARGCNTAWNAVPIPLDNMSFE